jgi:hypothetical protein
LRHVSRIRPTGVVAFIALFAAMSGFAVADDDGAVNGKEVNVGIGDIDGPEIHSESVGFAKLKDNVREAVEGGDGGEDGEPGPTGPPGSGTEQTVSIAYNVAAPQSNQTIYNGKGFLLRASSNAIGDCNLFLDSTEDDLSFAQYGVDTGAGTVTFKDTKRDEDFDLAEADHNLLTGTGGADEDDVILHLVVVPLSGARTTVELLVEAGAQGFDCRINGTATAGS